MTFASSTSGGMVAEHQATILSFARANDIVMLWRPINPHAATKLKGTYDEEGTLLFRYMGKALNTKGKSSKDGPIAGDIPCDVMLSKIWEETDIKTDEYQAKNDQILEDSKRQYTEFCRRRDHLISDGNNALLKELIEEANKTNYVVAMDKVDEEGREIYVMKDETGNIIRITHDGKEVPLFATTIGSEIFVYDYASKSYRSPERSLLGDMERVKILAYRQFFIDPKKPLEVQEKWFPITSDYDELVSSPRKLYPFVNNKEGIRTRVSSELYKKLACYASAPIDAVEVAAEVILEYELTEKERQRDRRWQGNLGAVNDLQWAVKTLLKIETEGATNHGPEINNPFPEPFHEGDYLVHCPNGETRILKTEEDIVQFINQLRWIGFPLDVNPKWGWEIDKSSRELFIPKVRFDWEMVHATLRDQKAELTSLEASIKSIQDELARIETIRTKDAIDSSLALQNERQTYQKNTTHCLNNILLKLN